MEERSLISYVWSYSWRRLRWKKNEGVSIIYSRLWFVMFLPCEVNSLNQDLLHRCSIVLLRLCFACLEWESAVTRDWSFSVLRVWFRPWLGAHISWNLIQTGQTTLGQTLDKGSVVTWILRGFLLKTNPIRPQHRLGIPPRYAAVSTLFFLFFFIPGVIRSMHALGCVLGLRGERVLALQAFVRHSVRFTHSAPTYGKYPRIRCKKYYLFLEKKIANTLD